MSELTQRELARILKVNQRVGSFIFKYRLQSSLSVEEICSKVDLSPSVLRRFESGFGSIPASKIQPILNLLGGNSIVEFASLMTEILQEQRGFIESNSNERVRRTNFEALGNVKRFAQAG